MRTALKEIYYDTPSAFEKHAKKTLPILTMGTKPQHDVKLPGKGPPKCDFAHVFQQFRHYFLLLFLK
jgi:hypothetical protein